MPIYLRCPNPACGHESKAPTKYLGHFVRCSRCKTKFKVDSLPETIAPAHAALETSPAIHSVPTTLHEATPRFGRFEIRRHLGSGAFGDVYRAFDTELQREVALKAPKQAVLDNPHLIERFLREGRAAAGLNHPNIVPVYDAGEEDGRYYLAAAFIEGRTLAAVIDETDIEFRRAVEVVRKLAGALAYAHGQGIVHRDIKPANIMMDEQGEPLLMDFGLAHRHEVEEKLTQEGSVMGTPSYMSPEQARGQQGEPLPASDQYSIGVILYEMLTGKLPFEGRPAIVMYNVIHTVPDAPRKLNPAISLDLQTICLKAMEKEPARRYASCDELAEDLRRWLEGEPVRARRMSGAERLVRWVKREARLVGLAVLTFICLTAASLLASSKSSDLADSKERTEELLEEAETKLRLAEEKAEQARVRKIETARQIEKAGVARDEAERQRQVAQSAREQQEKETASVVLAEKEAFEQERKRQQMLYEARIQIARSALLRGDKTRLETLIRQDIPQMIQKESRDIERYHLAGFLLRVECSLTLKESVERADNVCFLPDSMSIVICSRKGVEVRDAATGQQRRVLNVSGFGEVFKGKEPSLDEVIEGVVRVCFSPDGKRFAWQGKDLNVNVCDALTGQQLLTLKGHTDKLYGLNFSPDDSLLASGCGDGTVKVWDVMKGQEFLTLKTDNKYVFDVAFSPEGNRLASGGRDKPVKVWDVVTGKELCSLGTSKAVSRLSYSPDGKRIASTDVKTIELWDAATGKQLLSLKGHTRNITRVCFSPDGKRLASADFDGTFKVWDVVKGWEIFTLKAHNDCIRGLRFSPDGKRLVSVCQNMLKVWHLIEWKEKDQ